MAKLTDLSVSRLGSPDRGQALHVDGVVPGLYVRVSQGGSKTFVLVQGKDRRFLTLGRYGDITLAQAREAARKLRAEKTLGRILPSSVSLAEARTQYLAQLDIRANTRIYYERNLGRLKASRLSDIAPTDVNRVLDGLGRSSRNQCLASFRAFFKWCLRRHYMEKSPCELMQLSQSTSRSRVVTDAELKCIWEATADDGTFSTITRLLILTGQRPREIAALKAEYISDGVCTLPEFLCKNHRQHAFPIGALAASILCPLLECFKCLIFPARGAEDRPFNGWSKSKKALDKKLAGMVAPFQLRDLRRTYRTLHARIGTPPHISERLINHVSSTSEVEKIYDRYTYMSEMREAVARFEAHLLSVVEQPSAIASAA